MPLPSHNRTRCVHRWTAVDGGVGGTDRLCGGIGTFTGTPVFRRVIFYWLSTGKPRAARCVTGFGPSISSSLDCDQLDWRGAPGRFSCPRAGKPLDACHGRPPPGFPGRGDQRDGASWIVADRRSLRRARTNCSWRTPSGHASSRRPAHPPIQEFVVADAGAAHWPRRASAARRGWLPSRVHGQKHS